MKSPLRSQLMTGIRRALEASGNAINRTKPLYCGSEAHVDLLLKLPALRAVEGLLEAWFRGCDPDHGIDFDRVHALMHEIAYQWGFCVDTNKQKSVTK